MVTVLACPSILIAGNLQGNIASKVAAYEKKSKASVGVCVIDLRAGSKAATVRENQLFIPASNQKILTTAFALSELGKDFVFTTNVYRGGGDIIIFGDFDPTLGDAVLAESAGESIYHELDKWADAIQKSFGSRPVGDIVVCAGTDPKKYRHPDWPQKQHERWYAAPVARLNFHNNCYGVTFKLDGGKADAHILPASKFVKVTNAVKPGKRQLWSLRTNKDDSALVLKGTIKKPSTEPTKVATNNPPLLLGRVLADRLDRRGVKLKSSILVIDPKDIDLSQAQLLYSTTSPILAAVERANRESLNMAAECLLLCSGDGTWTGSVAKMMEALNFFFDISSESVRVSDGSGLSRNNRVTPWVLARVLWGMTRHEAGQIFIESLPVCGVDGTLKKRLKEKAYRGRVVAKTGYIAGVSALSGYVLDADNSAVFAFSVLINNVAGGQNWKAKQLQDNICRLLVDSLK